MVWTEMLEEINFLVLRNSEEKFCRRKMQILFTIESEFLRPSEQISTEMNRW